MQQVRSERLKDLRALWDLGVPAKTAGEFLSLGLPRFAGDDVGYLPFSVAPAEKAGEPEAPDHGDNPEVLPPNEPRDEPMDKLVRLIEGRTNAQRSTLNAQRSNTLVLRDCGCGRVLPGQLEIKASDSARLKLWKSHMLSRRVAVKRCAAKFTRVLMMARRETLAKIEAEGAEARGQEAGVKTRAAAADLLFDKAKFAKELTAQMRQAARASLDDAGKQCLTEVGVDDPFTMPPARIESFLKDRDQKLAGIPDDITARIREALNEGIEAGDSTAKLAARIKAEFNDIDDGRAETIAQTETGVAYGVARQEAMEQAGIEWREWLTSGLDNVRATHLEAEGQRRKLDEPFKVGAAELNFPGDPDGPPEEVINCHCVAIAVASGPEDEES
jgi:hypothetical protein